MTSEQSLDFNCSQLLFMAAFKPFFVPQVCLDTSHFELGAFLGLSGQTLRLLKLFDFFDRLINSNPPVLQFVFFVEPFQIQVYCRFLRVEDSLLSQGAHVTRPRLRRVSCQNSVLDVAQKVNTAVIKHSGQPLGSFAARW